MRFALISTRPAEAGPYIGPCVGAYVIRALLAVAIGSAAAWPAAAQDLARMEAVVDSYVTNGQFMGAVLVARGNDVLLDKGYGSANLEWDVPATPDTRFRIGSVTKQFTAAAILLLQERGMLSVTDAVRKHLPETPPAWEQVTIFHLLTHTAGIPNYTSFPEFQSAMALPLTTERLVAAFRDKPLEFEPGEMQRYSNSGYVLLGYLIETMTGASYEQFVQTNVFAPLGMKDSGYDSSATVLARRAAGYTPGPDGPVNAPYLHMSLPHAAGALYSTTGDLLRWNQGLFGGKLLTAASLAKMIAPFKNDYAFGLVVGNDDGRTRISHAGGINGFSSFLAFFPDTQITVAVLSNINGPATDAIAGRLGALAHGAEVTLQSERRDVTVSPKVLAELVGTYELAPGATMWIRLEGEQLTGQIAGQPRLPLFAESESRFFLKAVDAQIDFARDNKGVVSHLVLHQGGRDVTAARTSATVPPLVVRTPVTVAPDILARYTGTYELAPGFDLHITLEGSQLMAQATGQGKFPLQAESPTRFFFDQAGITIEFLTDANGAATHLQFAQQGALNVKAPRQ